ncbi:MAG: RNA polymerase sigma factor [Candidatus Aminicenantes bacterium]|nr:RNA polymerase sigma factor [Candidatus Aminicenantes bacterium]
MNTFSDDQIIRSVKEGRTQDFAVLVERYKKKIVNFINRMIYDYDEAQNIAQDVFLKVYETINKYKMEDNFSAFIFTIARNLTLNYIKKTKRTVTLSSFFSKQTEEKHFSSDAQQEEKYLENHDEETLVASLKELNENQRLALILKVYLDFSYKRIEEVTGWSVPKIETLISRAKNNLRNNFFLQEKRIKDV